MNDLRTRTAALLADVETELRHTDAADDQIGDHAANVEDKLTAAINKEQLEPGGDDPDREARWLCMLGHRNRAQRVLAVADDAKQRRAARRTEPTRSCPSNPNTAN